MSEEEKSEYIDEKQKLQEVLRNDNLKYYPLIIKASTAGTLETLLKEAEKVIAGLNRVQIIDFGVGPVTEGDMQHAL